MLRRIAIPAVIAGLLTAGLTGSAQATPTWFGTKTLSAAGQNSSEPQIAVNPAGTAVAVWSRRDDSGHWRIQTARRPVGGTWSAATTLSAAGQDALYPDVAIDDAGHAAVVWQRSDGTNPRVQERHSTPGGSWSAAVNVSPAVDATAVASVVMDAHGNTTVAWTGPDGAYRRIEARRRPAGGTWSQPTWLSASGDNSGDVDLAVNAAGTVVAVWSRVDNGHWREQAARRSPGGSWSTPVYLSGPNEDGLYPVAGIDSHGTATVVWRDVAGGFFVIMASQQPAGGSWTAPHSLSLPSSDAEEPRLAVNARGDAAATWIRFDGTHDRIQSAVRPAGGTWAAPVTISADGTAADEPSVAISRTGDVIAGWQSLSSPPLAQARRLPAGGTWGATAVFAPNYSDQLRVAFDGQGNAVAVWRLLDGPNFRTQATVFDAAGPVARVVKPAGVAQKARTFTVAWSAADRFSTVANKDVRYRSAAFNGGFGSWTGWKTHTSASSASFTGAPGRTYCFQVRATDSHGNVGAWSGQRCTAVPLDDRALFASAGWARQAGSGAYLGTLTVSSKHGAALTRAGVQARRVMLLATKCPGCGKVSVLLAGKSIGTVSLHAGTTVTKALIPIHTFATVHTGQLTIRIESTGKPVPIDGIVLARA